MWSVVWPCLMVIAPGAAARRLAGKQRRLMVSPMQNAVFPLHNWRHCILMGTFGKINSRAKEKTLRHFSSIRKR
jgi:hypothetical protein